MSRGLPRPAPASSAASAPANQEIRAPMRPNP